MAAARCIAGGARFLHVVDLEGARTGVPHERAALHAIVELAAPASVSVQAGGGIRTEDDAEELLAAGVTRVVLGTAALEEPTLAGRSARRWPGRVAVGLDYRVRADGVAEAQVQGWLAGSGRDLTELLALWEGEQLGAVVATAVARDGMLDGPDLVGLEALLRATALAGGRLGRGLGRGGPQGAGGPRSVGPAPGRRHRRQGTGRGTAERGGRCRRVRSVRLIPCLDVTGGRVVKGVRFVDLTDEGDPVELAARYDAEGADEVTFLDITASSDERETMVSVVARTAEQVFIPLTVGGGVRSADDARRLSRRRCGQGGREHRGRGAAGAGPGDRRRVRWAVRGGGHRRAGRVPDGRGWEVHTHGGRQATGRDAVAWAAECAGNGAGEILLTSMDRDGTRDGFDLALTRAVVDAIDIPVVASGGVGTLQHLVDGALDGGADAVLAASIFHRRTFTVGEAKAYMAAHGVTVRPPEAGRPAP